MLNLGVFTKIFHIHSEVVLLVLQIGAQREKVHFLKSLITMVKIIIIIIISLIPFSQETTPSLATGLNIG